jgi:hypothetical protein
MPRKQDITAGHSSKNYLPTFLCYEKEIGGNTKYGHLIDLKKLGVAQKDITGYTDSKVIS